MSPITKYYRDNIAVTLQGNNIGRAIINNITNYYLSITVIYCLKYYRTNVILPELYRDIIGNTDNTIINNIFCNRGKAAVKDCLEADVKLHSTPIHPTHALHRLGVSVGTRAVR